MLVSDDAELVLLLLLLPPGEVAPPWFVPVTLSELVTLLLPPLLVPAGSLELPVPP